LEFIVTAADELASLAISNMLISALPPADENIQQQDPSQQGGPERQRDHREGQRATHHADGAGDGASRTVNWPSECVIAFCFLWRARLKVFN
jgi:hypothetical protein